MSPGSRLAQATSWAFDVSLLKSGIILGAACLTFCITSIVGAEASDAARHTPIALNQPPLPNILRHYRARPPWPVAGVDYTTGADPALVMRSPATLEMSGVAVNLTRHIVVVSGNNVMLRGIDFGQGGGWGVYVTGQHDTVRDSSFHVGHYNIVPIAGGQTATDLLIVRCTIDGGGQGVSGDPAQIWSLIAYNGTNLTVEESWLREAPQHYIEFRQGRLMVRRNLFERAGYFAGAHVNAIQFSGSDAVDALFAYNTLYNPQPIDGYPRPGEGVQVEAQLNGAIRNTIIASNTLIATGPVLTASYLVAIRQDSGNNLVDGVAVRSNYVDPTGAYGAFYPYAGGSHIVFSDNMNMVSGRGIVPPASPGEEAHSAMSAPKTAP